MQFKNNLFRRTVMLIDANSHPHFTRLAHALLRIVAGLMFAQHGAQKLLSMYGGIGMPVEVGTQVWFAGVIELVGGLLIMFGLFTRPVAFICAGEMAVAYFIGHFGNGGFWPIENKGEMAVLYCFIFLYFFASGSGGYSLDALMRKRKGNTVAVPA